MNKRKREREEKTNWQKETIERGISELETEERNDEETIERRINEMRQNKETNVRKQLKKITE